jgi:hypothetical protein
MDPQTHPCSPPKSYRNLLHYYVAYVLPTNEKTYKITLYIVTKCTQSKLCRLVDWLIIYVFRPAQEFLTYTETSPLPVKGCKILPYARGSGPLSREGSLSCHTCCDTGTRFFRPHPKNRPIQSPLTTQERVWRIYSKLCRNCIVLRSVDVNQCHCFRSTINKVDGVTILSPLKWWDCKIHGLYNALFVITRFQLAISWNACFIPFVKLIDMLTLMTSIPVN